MYLAAELYTVLVQCCMTFELEQAAVCLPILPLAAITVCFIWCDTTMYQLQVAYTLV